MYHEGTGIHVPAQPTNGIPTYESMKGKHFWVIQAFWKWDPANLNKPSSLDHENMVSLSKPMCYHCEKMYSPLTDMRMCTGEPDAF